MSQKEQISEQNQNRMKTPVQEAKEAGHPWDAAKARSLAAIASQLFRCDQHEQHGEYREHCGACCLKGFMSESAIADGMDESDGPNYAGWARCYVQAQRPIPLHWLEAFFGQTQSDNRPFAEALARDLATWGVRFVPVVKARQYQPKTGQACHCRPGQARDNCPDCEGTGQRIDFAAIRTRKIAVA